MKISAGHIFSKIPNCHQLLIVLLIFGSVLASSHVYADAHDYTSCYVCNYAADDNTDVVSVSIAPRSAVFEGIFTNTDVNFYHSSVQSETDIRGPPTFSK